MLSSAPMAIISLGAPGKNAMSTGLMEHLKKSLREAAGEPVLLAGDGGVFSAGLNLREVVSLDGAGVARFLELLESLIYELYTYPGPTVAAIPGHAIAGGCVLALACDRRVSTPDPGARIGLNEVALGLRFPPVTWRMVHDRVPRQHHEEVLLGAGLFSPQKALSLGLVDELAEDPLAMAHERLATLAALDRPAYAATKRRMRVPAVTLAAGERELFERDELPVWSGGELKARAAAVLSRKGA